MTFTLLIPTTLYDVHGHRSATVLYYDAGIQYFGKEHLHYAIIAIIVLSRYLLGIKNVYFTPYVN